MKGIHLPSIIHVRKCGECQNTAVYINKIECEEFSDKHGNEFGVFVNNQGRHVQVLRKFLRIESSSRNIHSYDLQFLGIPT